MCPILPSPSKRQRPLATFRPGGDRSYRWRSPVVRCSREPPGRGATIDPRERRGPGGFPGLQNRWRGARRRAVGSTPMRSRHRRCARPAMIPAMSEQRARPRPPSVERVLAAARAGDRRPRPAAVLAMARAVVDEERARLAGSATQATARTPEALGRGTSSRDSRPSSGAPARSASSTPPASSSTRTSAGRRGRDAAIGPRAPPPRARSSSSSTARRVAAGRRYREAEAHLIALTGAEDALIVVNNAAAVALAVGLAGRGGVAVSRGELVEIGGGVRIPEIVRRAGAKLVEVGTTNRTRVADFEEVLADGRARLVLRVHPSNFSQAGFVEAPDAAALAAAAHRHGARSSSTTSAAAPSSTPPRSASRMSRCPAERLADGADLVTFSGDKLVGGPAGRVHRRSRGPRRPPAQGPARPRDAPRQGAARRGRRDPRALPGRRRDARDPGLAPDRGDRRRASRPAPPRSRRRSATVRRSLETEATIGGGVAAGPGAPVAGRLRRRPTDTGRAARAAARRVASGRRPDRARRRRPRPAVGRARRRRGADRRLAAALTAHG